MCFHVLDRGKHILRFVRLDVKHDQICPCIAKRADIAVRPVDHEMHIQKHLRMLAHRFHNRNADRDIGHENTVHHVYMDVVCAAGLDLCNIITERAKVCREDGWCKFGHGCHSDLKGSG